MVSAAVASLIAAATFSAVVTVAIALSLLCRTSRSAPWLRFVSVVPQGIYGGSAIKAFSERHDIHATAEPDFASRALHGIVGISLVAWALGATFWFIKLRSGLHTMRWQRNERHTSFLYILLVDGCFLICMLVALIFGNVYTSWSLDSCFTNEAYRSRPTPAQDSNTFEETCQQDVAIQGLAVVNLILLAVNSLAIAPLIAMPSIIRAQIFFISRALTSRRRRSLHVRRHPQKSVMCEKHDLGPTTKLANLFASDGLTRAVCRYLHVDDVANVAKTSKAMREVVLTTVKEDRIDLICTSACVDGEKEGCWACSKVICSVCKIVNFKVNVPRTRSHLKHCFALCTTCYLRKPSAFPAPFAATWNPSDLAAQHVDCFSRNTKDKTGTAAAEIWVRVCASCANMGREWLTSLREQRDEAALRATLVNRVRCKRCERALSRKNKRWWICELGPHECHWMGHEPL